MRAILIGCLAVAVLVPPYLAASVQTVTGVVVDQSGAAVPGATVTLKSVATGFSWTTATDAQGTFTLRQVPIGRATLTVVLAGFKTDRREIPIDAGRPVSLKIALSIAAVEE